MTSPVIGMIYSLLPSVDVRRYRLEGPVPAAPTPVVFRAGNSVMKVVDQGGLILVVSRTFNSQDVLFRVTQRKRHLAHVD